MLNLDNLLLSCLVTPDDLCVMSATCHFCAVPALRLCLPPYPWCTSQYPIIDCAGDLEFLPGQSVELSAVVCKQPLPCGGIAGGLPQCSLVPDFLIWACSAVSHTEGMALQILLMGLQMCSQHLKHRLLIA